MRRGKVFDEEKILYFASRESLFHVQPDEPKDSDCSRIVQRLRDQGLLVRVAADKAGQFFATTEKGEKRLLQLQIKWRIRNGKDVTEHEQKLAQLEGVQ